MGLRNPKKKAKGARKAAASFRKPPSKQYSLTPGDGTLDKKLAIAIYHELQRAGLRKSAKSLASELKETYKYGSLETRDTTVGTLVVTAAKDDAKVPPKATVEASSDSSISDSSSHKNHLRKSAATATRKEDPSSSSSSSSNDSQDETPVEKRLFAAAAMNHESPSSDSDSDSSSSLVSTCRGSKENGNRIKHAVTKQADDDSSSSSSSSSSESEDEKPTKIKKSASLGGSSSSESSSSSSSSSSESESSSSSDSSSSSSSSDSDSSVSEEEVHKEPAAKRALVVEDAKRDHTHMVSPEDSDTDVSDVDVSDVSSVEVSSSSDDDLSSEEESSSDESEDEDEQVARLSAKKAEAARKAKEATEAALNWSPSRPQKMANHEIITRRGTDGAQALSSGKPFQRVDDTFWGEQAMKHGGAVADNSYEGAFGNDGFGARASEKLLQVRGKDFRHEKTKRKRTFNGFSKAGGAINMKSFSTKFTYSDDE